MHVMKGTFDGQKVVIPDDVRGLPPGEVIVVFENGVDRGGERQAWTRIQEAALAKAWTNDEDSVYDTL